LADIAKHRNNFRARPFSLLNSSKEKQMDQSAQRNLEDLLEDIDVAMMITYSGGGTPHARPMQIAEAGDNGELYFATSLDSAKLRDIETDPRVMLTMQEGSVYISLTGTAHPTTDRALIGQLWSEAWQVWFPQGKDDPNIVILRVEPQEAEYWDNSGAEGVAYAMTALKAYVKGERPSETDAAQHGKVRM
jgi:general stress protein 26